MNNLIHKEIGANANIGVEERSLSIRQIIPVIILWLLLGITLGTLSIPLISFHFYVLLNRGNYHTTFLGFFIVLVLSDSRISNLNFAKDVKVLLMIILLFPFFIPVKRRVTLHFDKSFHKPFLPFLLISFFCIVFSPVTFTAFQKTLSYGLLFIIVPVLFYSLYNQYKESFLKIVVYLGALVLTAGYIMYLFSPSLVMYYYGGRSAGALGNPNALGIFSFLFYILYFTVNHYYPFLFSKRIKIIIPILIFSSLLWSGSRGQTLSAIIFLVTQFLSSKNKIGGLIISGIVGVMLVSIEIDVVAIAHLLGVEDYLRVETLDAGGGRVVARDFAFEQIEKNFWIGKGFNFTEWIFHEHSYELGIKGHEGNAHNAFLTVWLDTGFIGLFFFIVGWGILFFKAAKNSFLAFPIIFAIIASNMVESWLVGSLNPFTIQLLMILTILIYFVNDEELNSKKSKVNRSTVFSKNTFRV